jgi:hypothetical protein
VAAARHDDPDRKASGFDGGQAHLKQKDRPKAVFLQR